MKRAISVLLFCAVLVSLAACGKKAPTWQEQYDLGVKYLSQGNYEEAVIAFTAAIEIDPQQVEAYVSLAGAYREQGRYDLAREILQRGYDATGAESLLKLLEIEQLNQNPEEGLLDAAQGLLVSLRERERDKTAEYLERWLAVNGFWGLGDSGRSAHYEDVAFDGERFFVPQDGVGLSFFGESQIYYGEMSRGVPDGDGCMVVVQTIYRDEWYDGFGGIEYFWLDGHWENGRAVGEAEVWVDHSRRHDSADPEQAFLTTAEVHCVFGEEEVMDQASVTVRLKESHGDHRFEYGIEDGGLNRAEWSERDGLLYLPCMAHTNCGLDLSLEAAWRYRNPYRWGEYNETPHEGVSMFFSGYQYSPQG